jgi:hypothetical protein
VFPLWPTLAESGETLRHRPLTAWLKSGVAFEPSAFGIPLFARHPSFSAKAPIRAVGVDFWRLYPFSHGEAPQSIAYLSAPPDRARWIAWAYLLWIEIHHAVRCV